MSDLEDDVEADERRARLLTLAAIIVLPPLCVGLSVLVSRLAGA
jgi:hypothetical protein